MFPIGHYIKGIAKNLFNPRVSVFAIVSANAAIDKSAYINRFVKLNDVVIGPHSYIGDTTIISNTEMGNYVSIADNCRIGMAGHSLQCLSTSPIFTLATNGLHERWIEKDVFDNRESEERVHIGNDVWIASHVLVKGGVNIGDGACIAAGAVVVKDVPPYAIVGGVPAKIIRYRFPEDVIAKLLELKWWDLPEEKLKENIELFQKENISIEEIQKLI